MTIDLHMHSHYSEDGEISPRQIVDLAKQNQVDLIALTDHNSVKGVGEAIDYGKSVGVAVIPAVELDCVYQGKVLHLLAYHIDYHDPIFLKIEEGIINQERLAAKEKIRKIKEHTQLILDEAEVLARSDQGLVSGELIAEILFEHPENRKSPLLAPYLPGGIKSDMPNVHFYWDFLAQGKPAYVPIQFMSLQEALSLVKGMGGIAVLAHPGISFKHHLEWIDPLMSEGMDGIEVYSSYHSAEEIDFFMKKARAGNFIITCGSDFHGKQKPQIELGQFKEQIDFDAIREGLTKNRPF